MMYQHGPANGTLMLLPIDQGLEHGPVDFFDNPDAIDTDWVLRLAGRKATFRASPITSGWRRSTTSGMPAGVAPWCSSQRQDERPAG